MDDLAEAVLIFKHQQEAESGFMIT